MIAAMGSGSGKTIFTCGLIRVLSTRGIDAVPFKCGPDYIDPMYLRAAAKSPCRNLDVFLQTENGVRATFKKAGDGFAVIEAAMGYYDGLNGTDESSAYHVARLLDVPVILLVRPAKNSLTLAAEISGIINFRKDSHIVAAVFTDCTKKRYESLKSVIEGECDIPVLGYLPHIREASLPSRHLGLFTAAETDDLDQRFEIIKKAMEEKVDVHYICSL